MFVRGKFLLRHMLENDILLLKAADRRERAWLTKSLVCTEKELSAMNMGETDEKAFSDRRNRLSRQQDLLFLQGKV